MTWVSRTMIFAPWTLCVVGGLLYFVGGVPEAINMMLGCFFAAVLLTGMVVYVERLFDD